MRKGNQETFLSAMGEIEDSYIQEAEDYHAASQKGGCSNADLNADTVKIPDTDPKEDTGKITESDSNKDTRKKPQKGYKIWASAAAALCVAVIGVGAFLLNQNGTSGAADQMAGAAGATSDATDQMAGAAGATSDATDQIVGSADPESGETDQISGAATDEDPDHTAGNSGNSTTKGEAQSIDYDSFFQKAQSNAAVSADYTLEAGGPHYQFTDKTKFPDLPFDSSMFTEKTADIYCTSSNQPENLFLRLENVDAGQSVLITMSESGQYFSCFPLELKDGKERFGTMVYGFDRSETSDTPSELSLELYFTIDNAAYNISTSGLSKSQLGAIMDAILQDPVQLEAFDLSSGEKIQ